MALRIDLDKPTLVRALEANITVLRRGASNEINPLIKELKEKDVLKLQNAIATITDIK